MASDGMNHVKLQKVYRSSNFTGPHQMVVRQERVGKDERPLNAEWPTTCKQHGDDAGRVCLQMPSSVFLRLYHHIFSTVGLTICSPSDLHSLEIFV